MAELQLVAGAIQNLLWYPCKFVLKHYSLPGAGRFEQQSQVLRPFRL